MDLKKQLCNAFSDIPEATAYVYLKYVFEVLAALNFNAREQITFLYIYFFSL